MTGQILYNPKFQLQLIYLASLLFMFSSCNEHETGKSTEITFIHIPHESRIEVLFGGELFTEYLYPDELTKPVLMPLNTPDQKPLTRGFPIEPRTGERVDHPHQIGHWLNYGDVNGLDFWNNPGNATGEERDDYGFIEHGELFRMESGNGKGELVVSAMWKNYQDEVIIKENTTFVFSYSDNTRIIDRVTTLTAESGDVLFTDNKEGMIAIRVARELEMPEDGSPMVVGQDGEPVEAGADYRSGSTGNYLSSEGLTGSDVWGKRAGWMVLNGTMEGNPVALAMIDHPENTGYPTYWHARGYGLFSANPLGQNEFSEGAEELNMNLPHRESVTFRYRILVHSGSHLSAQEMDEFAENFVRHIL